MTDCTEMFALPFGAKKDLCYYQDAAVSSENFSGPRGFAAWLVTSSVLQQRFEARIPLMLQSIAKTIAYLL